MVRAMVHSTKHYVQQSLSTILGGAALSVILAVGVAVKDKTIVSDVEEGCTIKAVYCEFWIRAGDTVGSSGQMVLVKVPAGGGPPSTTEMAALNDYDNKKNVLYTQMGLYNDQDADALASIRGWFKIPKGKQRFGLGDTLLLRFFTPTIDLHICGFSTYKEYT